jgi:hypothetical protein
MLSHRLWRVILKITYGKVNGFILKIFKGMSGGWVVCHLQDASRYFQF